MGKRALEKRGRLWPQDSPGSVVAWLLIVTTKPPTWRDPFVSWRELSPTLGEPHEGFFYPDPLGFWSEVRRWATVLVRERRPGSSTPDALAVTALLHVGDKPKERVAWAISTLDPVVTLFLDEASWAESGITAVDRIAVPVPDPHRPGKSYEGFWSRQGHDRIVGKAPQHPASHKLYRADDLDRFLRSLPRM